MKIRKAMAFAAIFAALLSHAKNNVQAAQISAFDAYGYAPSVNTELQSESDKMVHLYERHDTQYQKNGYHLFERAGRRTIEARIRYFESDRVQITHDYGSNFTNGTPDSFHSMLRFSLNF